MWNYPKKEEIFEKLGKYAKLSGVIFIILGIIGIIFPTYMTLATEIFVSYLMLLAGVVAGYFTWITDKNNWLGWLKSFILVGVALLMLLYPMSGIATIGLLLAIYFFMDAFAGFAMASMHPIKGRWLWLFNGLLSLALGVLFLINWPFSSMYLIGIFVGISLFFDGFILFIGGSQLKKIGK